MMQHASWRKMEHCPTSTNYKYITAAASRSCEYVQSTRTTYSKQHQGPEHKKSSVYDITSGCNNKNKVLSIPKMDVGFLARDSWVIIIIAQQALTNTL